MFEEFDPEPVASASIAQVYRARLKPGALPEGALEGEVAVKVVRPGVPELVEVDIEIVREAADRLSRSALGRRYDFKGLASQLETTLFAELDLHQEALNARRIAESMTEFPRLRVPRVAEELTRRRVLVLEYVEGRKLTEIDARDAELADELWRAYLKQILVDGAFHCDPHPGNFLFDDDGKLAVLDHGMIAYVSRENQLRLMALLLALVERDGDRAARVCLEMGVPGRDFREARFRAAVGHLVARYSGVTMKDLPFGLIVRDLLVLCLRNDIQIPPELVLLGKTLLNLEPLCRKLDPDLDPVRTMKDMAIRLVEEQFRRDISVERLLALLLELRSFVYEVPVSVRRLLTQAANNELRVGIELEKADEMKLAIRDVANRITLGVITAALILGSAFLLEDGSGVQGPRLPALRADRVPDGGGARDLRRGPDSHGEALAQGGRGTAGGGASARMPVRAAGRHPAALPLLFYWPASWTGAGWVSRLGVTARLEPPSSLPARSRSRCIGLSDTSTPSSNLLLSPS